jgi:hypothetical protein
VELVNGPELYAYLAGGSATTNPDDLAWSDEVAAAINAAATHELELLPEEPEPVAGTPAWDDLHAHALMAGAETYKRREAPFGIAGFDVQGGAIRMSADDLKPLRAAIARWHRSGGIAVA